MMRSTRKTLSFLGLVLILFPSSCKKLFSSETEVPVKKTCVDDLETARAQGTGLETELSKRVSATLIGTVHFAQAIEKLDHEIATTCSSLARDLGGSKPEPEPSEKEEPEEAAAQAEWYQSTPDTKENAAAPKPDEGAESRAECDLAVERIRAKREEAGAVLIVEEYEPSCSGRVLDYQKCALDCDDMLPPEAVMSCGDGETSGRCEAKCSGECVAKFTDTCNGICRGTCEGRCTEGFYGSCGGRCVGDCDGKPTSGKCEGVCDGKCLSNASGWCEGGCRGKCAGSCFAKVRQKSCDGRCVGSCSEEMNGLQCQSVVPPVEMIPACHARCDAELASRQLCDTAHVEVTIYASKEERKAKELESLLSKRLPAVVSVDSGMRRALESAGEGLSQSLGALQENMDADSGLKKKLGSCLNAAAAKHGRATETLESFRKMRAELIAATRN